MDQESFKKFIRASVYTPQEQLASYLDMYIPGTGHTLRNEIEFQIPGASKVFERINTYAILEDIHQLKICSEAYHLAYDDYKHCMSNIRRYLKKYKKAKRELASQYELIINRYCDGLTPQPWRQMDVSSTDAVVA